MAAQSYKFLVSGKVQGVGYRAFVSQLAARYALTGKTENLYDGSVEIIFNLAPYLLDDVLQLLKKGPPMAIVSAVSYEEIDQTNFNSFNID